MSLLAQHNFVDIHAIRLGTTNIGGLSTAGKGIKVPGQSFALYQWFPIRGSPLARETGPLKGVATTVLLLKYLGVALAIQRVCEVNSPICRLPHYSEQFLVVTVTHFFAPSKWPVLPPDTLKKNYLWGSHRRHPQPILTVFPTLM